MTVKPCKIHIDCCQICGEVCSEVDAVWVVDPRELESLDLDPSGGDAWVCVECAAILTELRLHKPPKWYTSQHPPGSKYHTRTLAFGLEIRTTTPTGAQP